MTDVKHMKWWGWGVEGVAFNPDNKPAFAPFVKKAVGLDLSVPAVPPAAFSDLTLPSTTIDDDLLGKLAAIVGADNAVTENESRLIHTYGKSIRDLIRIRASDLPRMPDVVLYPADESQVAQVVQLAVAQNAVVIPFGGGSNIAGSLTPSEGEARVVISLDLGRLNDVVSIDEGSGLARIQAGAQGPRIEEQLNERGWTMGHFPDSFTHSTLGGWVATRSSGMQSDKYGDIADITRGLHARTAW